MRPSHFSMTLGKCEIAGGTPERNWFIYFDNGRRVVIDLDSDYGFTLWLGQKNPAKAVRKAVRVAQKFIGRQVTAKELINAGFTHDIPEKKLLQLQ